MLKKNINLPVNIVNTSPKKRKTLDKQVTEKLQHNYREHFIQKLKDSEKPLYYKHTTHKILQNCNLIRHLTKLRTCAHRLERGRHRNIPRKYRLYKLWNKAVKDASHFLVEYKKLERYRRKHFIKLTCKLLIFQTLTKYQFLTIAQFCSDMDTA